MHETRTKGTVSKSGPTLTISCDWNWKYLAERYESWWIFHL